MNEQIHIFDKGIDELLEDMRSAAVKIALECGEVSADDVRAVVPIPESITRKQRNALGSLFKTKDFVSKGFKQSTTPSRGKGAIFVWTLSKHYRERTGR